MAKAQPTKSNSSTAAPSHLTVNLMSSSLSPVECSATTCSPSAALLPLPLAPPLEVLVGVRRASSSSQSKRCRRMSSMERSLGLAPNSSS